MPVRFERAPDFLRIILEGSISLTDLYDGVDEIYATTVPTMVLWDMLNATAGDDEDVPEKLRAFSKYAAAKGIDRDNGRVALLAPNALQFGLSRMSTTFAEHNEAAYNMQPFRTEDEALRWLRNL